MSNLFPDGRGRLIGRDVGLSSMLEVGDAVTGPSDHAEANPV